ncbi:uncharacterized protein LOC122006156 [Zingiber officinale]|uniref:Stress response NST1-like protein n=1 Tax=Zingiber officinale TaxID=94328 RepID=A0A8J5KUI5_ZINOF|nr:uncharacterized protein LOC122006156 [Zingiber officinale]KAG6490053.1 hypothetical protein ZIOFF_051335 [Zingiber officinale]
MCILCVVPRWSRRIATLLPWLLIPVLFFWGMSPFLPPGLRFEITSPRIACLCILVVTLIWYKGVVPMLNYWQACRTAREQERQRALAIKMQQLLKTATRRCRNCHTTYRDQNPAGGRFMCSYCGHVSKRPVLDLPRSVGSSWFSKFMGNYRWLWSQDSQAQRNINVRWLCRLIFRHRSREDGSNTDRKGVLYRRGDNGGNLQENRCEKMKRKAEEKRQAKLEREMLEEEERKQREEVAKLVEERRKLRDENVKTERETSNSSVPDGERDNRKQADKKRDERRKDKDRGSSKSNSDVEDLEKRASRATERKHEFHKKTDNERQDSMGSTTLISKSHTMEASHGNKVTASKTKYSSHITGNSPSSARSFGSSILFGRNMQNPTSSVTKPIKQVAGFMNPSSKNARDFQGAGDVIVNAMSSGNSGVTKSNLNQPMNSYVQPRQSTLKKPWHQLFTHSAPVSTNSESTNLICQNNHGQVEAQNMDLKDQTLIPNSSYDNSVNFVQPLPFNSMTSPNGVFNSTLFTNIKDSAQSFISDEAEIYEDPCYVPDMISLLGPVSEELDNFPLDARSNFLDDNMAEPHVLKNAFASVNISKPSPIECPISRFQNSEEKQNAFGPVSCTLKYQEPLMVNVDESQGMWQMWETPHSQNTMGLLGGPSSWLLAMGQQNLKQDDIPNPLLNNTLLSQSMKVNPALLRTKPPLPVHDGVLQNEITYGAYSAGMNGSNSWIKTPPLQSLPSDGVNLFLPPNLIDNMQHVDTTEVSPNKSGSDYSILSSVDWVRPHPVGTKEWPHSQKSEISHLGKANTESQPSFRLKETLYTVNETMFPNAYDLTSHEDI